jgi:MFS family permease
LKTSFITILKNREFLKIWLAQLISVVTANMLNFIIIGKIFESTGSAVAIGFLWAFYVFPTALLGPFSGVLLDFLDKRKILFWSSFLQSFVALFYLGIGKNIWLVYMIVLLYSFLDEFFMPTISVLIPSVVKKKELAAANSISLFTVNGSIVLGFLAGGLMLKFLGYTNYLFFVASGLLVLGAIIANRLKWQEPKKKKRPEFSLAGFVRELMEGYNFIRGETLVLFPMILLAGLQIVLGMGLILTPSISNSILFIDFADSSYLLIVPAVIGAFLGSLVVERNIEKYLKRVLIINGLFLLGISIVVFGLLLQFLWIKVALGALLAFLTGVAFTMMFIPLQILVQENTPFRVRGRVFGTLNTLITVAAAVPVLGTVTLVDLLGVKLVLTITGIGVVALAFYAKNGKYGFKPNMRLAN